MDIVGTLAKPSCSMHVSFMTSIVRCSITYFCFFAKLKVFSKAVVGHYKGLLSSKKLHSRQHACIINKCAREREGFSNLFCANLKWSKGRPCDSVRNVNGSGSIHFVVIHPQPRYLRGLSMSRSVL